MLDLSPLLFAPLQLLFFPLVVANSIHNVTVGIEGSFFSPQTVSAAAGDVVNFIVAGDIHTITQSTPENPCSPLPGGFSSGLLGRGMDFTGPTEIFILTVTDASAPIWYFCAATEPASHCNHQMVGVINPPSQAAFMSFENAAILATTTPPFSPSLVLNGQGATATVTTLNDASSPRLSPSVFTPTPASSLTPTPPTSTPSASSSSSEGTRAAVIGGAVGAAVGAFLLLCFGFFLWYRIKKQRRSSTGSQFFAYNHTSDRGQGLFGLAQDGSGSPPPTAISTINYSSAASPNAITTFDIDRETQHLMPRQPPPPPMRAVKSASSNMTSEYSHSHPNVGPLQPLRNLSHTTSAGQFTQVPGVVSMYSNNPNYHHNYNPSITQQGSSGFTEEPNAHRPAEAASSTGSDPGAQVDVKALAREVVTLIRQEQEQGSGKDSNVPTNVHRRSQLESPGSVADSLQSAPPLYNTVENAREV